MTLGSNWIQTSERPKPPFWFRPDTETETVIGQYFRPIPKPIPKPPNFSCSNTLTYGVWDIFSIKIRSLNSNSKSNKVLLLDFWEILRISDDTIDQSPYDVAFEFFLQVFMYYFKDSAVLDYLHHYFKRHCLWF